MTGNQEDYSEVRQELEKHENLNFMMSYIMTLQFLMHVKGTNIHMRTVSDGRRVGSCSLLPSFYFSESIYWKAFCEKEILIHFSLNNFRCQQNG